MATSVPFDATVELLIYLFIGTASFCVGLATSARGILAVLADKRLLWRALIANIVIPPVIAVLVIVIFPLDPVVETVLVLLAVAPGGINAVQFSTKVPGQMATAGALLFLLSTVALVTAPATALFLLPPDSAISIPIGEIAIRAVVLIAVPASVGMALGRSRPTIAQKLYKPAMLVSALAFIASVVLSTSVRQAGLAQFDMATTLAMLTFILGLIVTGWVLGGPGVEERQVFAVATNLRNVGLVYVLVEGCCSTSLHAAAVLGFMALMVLPNLVLTVGCGLWRKRHPVQ